MWKTCALSILLISSFWQSANSESLSGCFTKWAPYSDLVDNKPLGISIDIVKEAATRAGFELTLELLPWKRCLQMVKQGNIDFALDSVDRSDFIHGEHPSSLYTLAFWARDTDVYDSYENVSKLVDKRLGLLHGYVYSPEILDAGFIAIEWVESERMAAQMISADRLDLTFADTAVMLKVIRDTGVKLKPLLPVHSTQPLYPSFNMSLTHVRDRIDKELGQMYTDETIDKIYQQHTGMYFHEFTKLISLSVTEPI